MEQNAVTVEQISAENQRYMVKVYFWMCLAMAITGTVSMYTAMNDIVTEVINSSPYFFITLFVLHIVAVVALAKVIMRLHVMVATAIFVVYSILFGLTLSFLFKVFAAESIASTFFITSGTFGIMSLYGLLTKTDLSKGGNHVLMGVIGVGLAAVVTHYTIDTSILYLITTYAGIILFVSLTAYDSHKIKNANVIGNEGTDDDHKESIKGALILYLDFIALFLFLLHIFGRRR
jgi:FtsH-binding integral membrane protein